MGVTPGKFRCRRGSSQSWGFHNKKIQPMLTPPLQLSPLYDIAFSFAISFSVSNWNFLVSQAIISYCLSFPIFVPQQRCTRYNMINQTWSQNILCNWYTMKSNFTWCPIPLTICLIYFQLKKKNPWIPCSFFTPWIHCLQRWISNNYVMMHGIDHRYRVLSITLHTAYQIRRTVYCVPGSL